MRFVATHKQCPRPHVIGALDVLVTTNFAAILGSMAGCILYESRAGRLKHDFSRRKLSLVFRCSEEATLRWHITSRCLFV